MPLQVTNATHTRQYLRSITPELYGNSLPDFFGGFSTNLQWKSFTLHAVLDSRFVGRIWSGYKN